MVGDMDESEWIVGPTSEPSPKPNESETDSRQWLPHELEGPSEAQAEAQEASEWLPAEPSPPSSERERSADEPIPFQPSLAHAEVPSASPPAPASDGDVTDLIRRAKATAERLAEIEDSTRSIMDRMTALASRVDDGRVDREDPPTP